jgi:TIR domain
MAIPLNQRINDVFLSHSSRDKPVFVDALYCWLTQGAGLKVSYDRGLASGNISANLDKAIDTCRSAIIVISGNSAQSPWVETEAGRLMEEVSRCGGDFRIATVRIDNDADAPGLFKAFKHVDFADGKLSADGAALLMETLFGGNEGAGKPVYLSRGWRPAERPAAERIIYALQTFGLKLVCDWTDQPRYSIERVRKIMEGTGGLVAILPHRGNGLTSSYIIDEVAAALNAGLPVLIFAHKDVVLRPDWSSAEVVSFDSELDQLEKSRTVEKFANEIEGFAHQWTKPRGEHVFLGHSLEESIKDEFQMPRRLLSRLTGLPVEVGGLVSGSDAQSEIVRLIQDAELCVIDITNLTYKDLHPKIDFALNSCIEAGIALGCNKDLYLTCRGPRRTPPFMFRNKQIWYYENEIDLVAKLRQIAALHRRMVL